MKPAYEVLNIEQFGHELITSGDLDPVYIMLQGLPEPRLSRFLVAYWCTYHVGVSSYLADCDKEPPASMSFWQVLGSVATQGSIGSPVGGPWPRGKERRHWRGRNAARSWDDLRTKYAESPLLMTGHLHELARATPTIGQMGSLDKVAVPFKKVADFIKTHDCFGPWIAFKIADMCEQVMDIPVDFREAEVFMFETPKDAARLLFLNKSHNLDTEAGLRLLKEGKVRIKDEEQVIHRVVAWLTSVFKTYPAPNNKRGVGLQEVETILCKWKSHCSGHYPLYNDIGEVTEQLSEWRFHSQLAGELYSRIPQAGVNNANR